MFVPRNTDIESCPSGHVSCTPANIAISGTDPSTTSDPTNTPVYVSKPGMHRFIGIVMVIILVLVGVALWMHFAKYPRRKLGELSQWVGWRCCGRRPKPLSEKSEPGDISRTTSTSSSDTHCSRDKSGTGVGDGEAVAKDDTGAAKAGKRRAEKEKQREKERNLMLQAEPRGVVKEVSGGVVMYTEVPRPALLPRSRDRHGPRQEWEFEHSHGVRFEARSPPRSKPSSPRS